MLPNYIPVQTQTVMSRDELIETYFHLGLSGPEILSFLSQAHNIQLSLRQLRRILKSLGCKRRQYQSDVAQIINAIETEICSSGQIIGYRAMHQRLITYHGLTVKREVVRHALKILDPEGVEQRTNRRFRRRKYCAKGPNYLWHIDGYDKLKPFGFGVHGCIDGYSRRILWLEVSYSNNDPHIVVRYFLDYVKELGGTARIIRGDCGTENVLIEKYQRFFRRSSHDSFSGDKSFMYGRSTSNQRIESWWSILRRGCSEWWISFFKDMRDSGLFDDSNAIHRQCLRFCFMGVLQKELHKVATLWNTHRIRKNTNIESPAGRPDVNYFIQSGDSLESQECLIPVSSDEVSIAEEITEERVRPDGCSDSFVELVGMIMDDEGLQVPSSPEDAKLLYVELLRCIADIN